MYFRTKLLISELMAASLLVAMPAARGQVQFSGPTNYPVGTAPVAIAIADFNGDGNLDLAVANSGDKLAHAGQGVSILLGNGNGTFQPAQQFDAGVNPSSIAAADFNRDGKLDLVVADFGDSASGTGSGLSVLLGNGNGTFQAPTNLTTSAAPDCVVVEDFDGDGKPDLAVGQTGGRVLIFLGKGDGTFQLPVEYDTDFSVNSIAVRDLNGDGKLDIVAATGLLQMSPSGDVSSVGAVSILIGNGDGSFQPALNYGVDNQEALSVALGDFNGDGKVDLVAATTLFIHKEFQKASLTASVSVLLGNGDGTFQPLLNFDPVDLNFDMFVEPGDFNGDKNLDLAVLDRAGGGSAASLRLLLGNGDGSFQTAAVFNAETATSLAQADFNHDGAPDLVLTNSADNTVGVLLNTSGMSGFTLAVTRAGAGTVASNPLGINCGGTCSSIFAEGTTVTLTAVPAAGSTFAGWSGGGCIGAGPCSVTMNANQSVTANFAMGATLSVTVAGIGSGSITSSSGGISCTNTGGSCSQLLSPGTSVSLRAAPSANSVFAGWSGACSGTDPNACSITLNSDLAVTATFNPAPDFTLSAASQNLTVKRGSQASDVLTIGALSGFSGSVGLMCSVSGPSPTPTCGISPATVIPGTNATLTVNAAALAAAVGSRPFERTRTLFAMVLPFGLMSLALTTCFNNKRRKPWALCLLMLVTMILQAACSGTNSAPPPPVQTYTVTVTAMSGALQHSSTVSVTVN